MKKILVLAASALITAASAIHSDACTNHTVGRKASANGSVICTYNCDGYGFASSLSYSGPGHKPDTEKLPRADSPLLHTPPLSWMQ